MRSLIDRRPNTLFLLTFFGLNALLFLPFYFLNPDANSLLPPLAIFDQGLWDGLNQLFLWRDNLDPFRISLELTLLTALWVMVAPLRRPAAQVLIALVYLLALCYAIYEAIMLSFFLTEPDFYSQYYWARDGLPFLLGHLGAAWWIYALALLGVVAIFALLLMLINALLKSAASPKLHLGLRLVMVGLAAFCIFAAFRYQIWTAKAEMAVSSLAFKLDKNIGESLQLYHDVASFDDQVVRRAYDYSNYHLAQKPDIYLIFVESYGSVLYRRDDYRKDYTALLGELKGKLDQAGWQSTSNLSESPMWGGGSWMAYTSTLFGLRIDNQARYLSLFNKYQVDAYPGLGRTLEQQGYQYVWLSAIENELSEQEWAKQIRFQGADRVLSFQDFDYQGAGYGWGPSPADQYVLNYAQEKYLDKVQQPLFFFMITQNSHYPWIPQPTFVDDWRTLNAVQSSSPTVDPEAIDHQERRQNYMRAVDYQLRTLTDFILRNGDDNSLFVLIGDHQPPRVSRKSDGWATPVHIISKDGTLIKDFADYGFVPGLQVQSYETELHHEGIYSMLMRVLLKRYGSDPSPLPAYLPQGVKAGEVAVNGQ